MKAEQNTTRLICPLIATSIEEMRADMIAAKACGADMVECRLDFLSPLPDAEQLDELLTDVPLPVLATCRPTRQGGQYAGNEIHRLALLGRVARYEAVEYVDIEDDVPCEDWPTDPAKILLSHHNFETIPVDLDEIIARMDASDAAINKVAFAVAGPDEAMRAFDVIRSAKKPTVALAMGEHGLLTRLLAKKFGAWGTFAALMNGQESAPGQPSLDDMHHLYRWDTITSGTQVYGVAGCPIAHSMSPAIHNAAFTETGDDAVFVLVRIEPGGESFARFIDAVTARPWLKWRGLSVTIPHKENALEYIGSDNCDELACQIGAVNTVTFEPDGRLYGDNTDYAGAIDALCQAMGISREQLAGRKVAVLGAGGAARAIVAALRHYQATVTIYNRTVQRAETLAAEFGAVAAGNDALEQLDAEIVINCTPVGMHPNVNQSPLEKLPSVVDVVFDTIYNPLETCLLHLAKQDDCVVVSGLDMFVNQAVGQFVRWTGNTPPVERMRKVVVDRLQA